MAAPARQACADAPATVFVRCATSLLPLLALEHCEERRHLELAASVEGMELAEGEAVACDGCGSVVVDLCFGCSRCAMDFCPFCAAEARVDEGGARTGYQDALPSVMDVARSPDAAKRLCDAGSVAARGEGIPRKLLPLFRGAPWPGDAEAAARPPRTLATATLPIPQHAPPCPSCARKNTTTRLALQQRTDGTRRRQLYALVGLPWLPPLPPIEPPGPVAAGVTHTFVRSIARTSFGDDDQSGLVANVSDNGNLSICLRTQRSHVVGAQSVPVITLAPPAEPPRRRGAGPSTSKSTAEPPPRASLTQLACLRVCLKKGTPMLVRGCLEGAAMQWDANFFAGFHRSMYKKKVVEVDDCDDGARVDIKTDDFWNGYHYGDSYFQKPSCYRFKDWPTESALKDHLPDQNEDLIKRVLPFPQYTCPTRASASAADEELGNAWAPGSCNIAARPERMSKKATAAMWGIEADLGPKLHFSYGRGAKRPTERMGLKCSVERLTLGIADLCAVIMDAVPKKSKAPKPSLDPPSHATEPDEKEPACVWHVFAPHETEPLRAWMMRNKSRLLQKPQETWLHDETMSDPYVDACVYLTESDLTAVGQELGFAPSVIYQAKGSAVIIPAGCAFQVLNVRSNIRAVVDFVAPESATRACDVALKNRSLPEGHAGREDRFCLNGMLRDTLSLTAQVLATHIANMEKGPVAIQKGKTAGRKGAGGGGHGNDSDNGDDGDPLPPRKRNRTGPAAGAPGMRAKGKSPVHAPTEPDALFEERMADGGDVDEMPDADEGAATEHEEDARAEFEAARAGMKAAVAALPSEDDEDGAFTDDEKEGEMVVDKAEEAVQEETGEEAQDEDEEGGATAVTAEEEDYAEEFVAEDADKQEEEDSPVAPPLAQTPGGGPESLALQPHSLALEGAPRDGDGETSDMELTGLEEELAAEREATNAAREAAEAAEAAAERAFAAADAIVHSAPPLAEERAPAPLPNAAATAEQPAGMKAARKADIAPSLAVDPVTGAITNTVTGEWMGSQIEPDVPPNPFARYADEVDRAVAAANKAKEALPEHVPSAPRQPPPPPSAHSRSPPKHMPSVPRQPPPPPSAHSRSPPKHMPSAPRQPPPPPSAHSRSPPKHMPSAPRQPPPPPSAHSRSPPLAPPVPPRQSRWDVQHQLPRRIRR